MSACCTGRRAQPAPADDGADAATRSTEMTALAALGAARPDRDRLRGTVRLDGGTFAMGSEDAEAVAGDGEGPVRDVTVSPFRLDETAVTNRQFRRFVRETGYRTDAERFGWSFVFAGYLTPESRQHLLQARVPGAPWWLAVEGVDWRTPTGTGSDLATRDQHPVVHVSHHDALAYAAWAGRRLPTEAEWEFAARGGLAGARYAWGDELTPGRRWRANIFQGSFPASDTGADGFVGTAPVKSYAANGYGLYEMAGNTWEWCSDWFSATWHVEAGAAARVDPAGPPDGSGRVIRGGSHLCHDSYCNRYRVSARTSNTPDSSTSNMGFRCAL
jgi:sulfatase modifying factor 1